MPMPFDATLKELLSYIDHWLARLGLDVHGKIEEITPDLSTVTTTADKVYRIEEEHPWLLHLEMQASREESLPRRTLKQNGLLHDRCDGLPVHSVIFLLRREADDSSLTGVVSYGKHPQLGEMEFRYHVERVWQWPVEELLAGGLGTLALAPLSREVTEATLPAVIQRMADRFRKEAPAPEAGKLLTAAFILLGLRFAKPLAERLFQGVRAMEESVTYQAIIEKGIEKGEARGRVEEARRLLLRQGRIRFGPPDEATQAAVAAIADVERLERWGERLVQVTTWQELLDTP